LALIKKDKLFQPAQVLAISFALAILIGALLLLLPFSTTSGRISFVDALFTSTSAVCVTGLIVQDTPTYFTLAGQVIILLLIQLGGLGVMTFSTMVLLVAGRKIAFTDRILVQEGFHPSTVLDFRSLIKNVFFFTFSIEFLGCVLLLLRFQRELPWPRALYSSLFHAVSAFCNAGFSVNSNSFMSYRGDVLVNLTVVGLIVLGGLGFLVIQEVVAFVVSRRRGMKAHLSLHSKLVLSLTGLLIGLAFVIFVSLEWRNALAALTPKEKILASLFQVVTPRTAGFNTMDLNTLGTATVTLIMLLMFIGASPGSTGGGVKTSTFATVLAFIRSKIVARESVNLFYRTIPQENVIKAFTVLSLATCLIFISTFLVLATQPGMLIKEVLFEVFSAFGTVGLSLGITPALSPLSKVVVVMTMYAGRVGPLTLLYAFSRRRAIGKFEYVEERVMIG
jgi:trk system potassium uptake protein TrkH